MDGRPDRRNKAAFSNSSGLKNVFKKLRFRDGLVWTVDLTGEIKLRFQIPLAYCEQDLNFKGSDVYTESYFQ